MPHFFLLFYLIQSILRKSDFRILADLLSAFSIYSFHLPACNALRSNAGRHLNISAVFFFACDIQIATGEMIRKIYRFPRRNLNKIATK